jgi:mannose-6-phosphate isomerase-like protein (cupin superfamily)
MITEIKHDDEILAIIVAPDASGPGIQFFTPGSFSQQLAFMRHPPGKIIQPHLHNTVVREVQYTLEVLVIKRGRLRVDFYDSRQNYLESRVLGEGNAIVLVQGGHGFEVLEELEMYEVKQGPYAGERDKTRFEAKLPEQINYGSKTDFR